MKNSQQSQSPQSITPNSGIMNVYEDLLFRYPDVIPQDIKDNFAKKITNNSADKINIELPSLDPKTNYTFTQIDGMYFLGKSFVNEDGKKQFTGFTKVSNTDLVFEGSYFDSDKVQEKNFIGKFINATDPSFDVINQGSKISLVALHPQHLKQALTDKKLPEVKSSTHKTMESKVVGERDNFLRNLVERESKSNIPADTKEEKKPLVEQELESNIPADTKEEKKPSIFTSIGKKFNQFFKGAYSSHSSSIFSRRSEKVAPAPAQGPESVKAGAQSTILKTIAPKPTEISNSYAPPPSTTSHAQRLSARGGGGRTL
jgi:hypothetical protein